MHFFVNEIAHVWSEKTNMSNFHPLVVVVHVSEKQFQVEKNSKKII